MRRQHGRMFSHFSSGNFKAAAKQKSFRDTTPTVRHIRIIIPILLTGAGSEPTDNYQLGGGSQEANYTEKKKARVKEIPPIKLTPWKFKRPGGATI